MNKENFYLDVNIETKDNNVSVPIANDDKFQVRTDGIYLDGELFFWECIKKVTLTPIYSKQEE